LFAFSFRPTNKIWGAAGETFPKNRWRRKCFFRSHHMGSIHRWLKSLYSPLYSVYIIYIPIQNTFRLSKEIGYIILLQLAPRKPPYRAALYRSVDPPPPSNDVRVFSSLQTELRAYSVYCIRRVIVLMFKFLYTYILYYIHLRVAHTFSGGAILCWYNYCYYYYSFNAYNTRKPLCSEGLRAEESTPPHRGGWWEGRGGT